MTTHNSSNLKNSDLKNSDLKNSKLKNTILTRIAILIAALTVLQTVSMAQSLQNNYSDLKPGSVLFFNRYTSSPLSSTLGDTQINITNFHQSRAVNLHFFFVDGSSCSVADSGTSLAANQTATFMMSESDPGTYGYIIVVASNDTGGLPFQFNYLAGTAYVRESDGRQGTLQAISIGKLSLGDITPDPTDGKYKLKFNGTDYEKFPYVAAISSVESQTTSTGYLYIYSPSTNLYYGETTTVNVSTLLFDDSSVSTSSSFTLTCYRQDSLSTLFSRSGGINRRIPAGRTGWIRMSGGGGPILGSVIFRNALFGGGYNLHAISLYGSHEIILPY